MIARLRWFTIACVVAIGIPARAADNFDCGPGGVPDPKTSRCACPPNKIEKTVGGISRCVLKPPPVVTPKPKPDSPPPPPPPPPPLPSCTPSQKPTDTGCVDACAADEVYRDGLCVARCPKSAKWDGATCVATGDDPLPPSPPPPPAPLPAPTPSPVLTPPTEATATSANDDVASAPTTPFVIPESTRRWGPQRLDFGIPFAVVVGYTSARNDVTYGGGGIAGTYHFSGVPLMLGAALTAGPYRAGDVACASSSCTSSATVRGTAVLFEVTAAFAPFSIPHVLESPVSWLNPFVGPTIAAYDFSAKDETRQKVHGGVALLLTAGNSFLFRLLQKDDGIGVFFGVTPAVAVGLAGGGAMPTTRATLTFSATVVGP